MKILKFSKSDTTRYLILTVVLSVIVVFGYFFYRGGYVDQYYLIKPLPHDVPIEIRVDRYGDGHFGAPRRGYKHRGIDILADIGTPVLACKSGRVAVVDYDKLSGNYIIIRHRGELTSLYLHLEDVYIKEGQRVRQGDIIGTVGKTGNARFAGVKPHLHFEIRKDDIPQDILGVYKLKSLTED